MKNLSEGSFLFDILNSLCYIFNMKFIDLFAGMGGMRMSFDTYGKCVFSSEIDEYACKTYEANFGENPQNDITKTNAEDIPEHDILICGIPCQAFSIAGEKKGFEDTRGTLFYDVLRIVKYHKPKVIFIENVKGLVVHDKGNTLKIITDSLELLNYHVVWKVLKTSEYVNIPQIRERIFIVCFNKETVPNYLNFNFPNKVKLTRGIHNFISDKKQDDYFYYKEGDIIYERVKNIITDKNKIYQIKGKEKIVSFKNKCPTLIARMGTGGNNIPTILDDYGIRKLTPRECLNFQGFPDNYILPNISKMQLYKQIGNSVTKTLIDKIVEEIMKVI